MIGELYEESLQGAEIDIEYADGRREPLRAMRWLRPIDGDEAMLSRCTGPTLDVGSGPGRLTVALAARGVAALGIDVTPHAVRLTLQAGGMALCRDVFGRVPGAGRWATALLADGNIGIGGDPVALLRRMRQLVRPGGEVIAEVAPPGTPSRIDRVRLRQGEVAGEWFGWADVSASDAPWLAGESGFEVTECHEEAGRWFVYAR
ncbi:SAM-dependent methyltransferase [Nonomuraea phyllanthi]|uniref:SAM-dependent methyltransferase n=1 Tax=Nonomuraea phyllanthi TaxID=2219224 RepID=A0A5C4WA15_9ACTN|nr:methyltransferase domain-containing protein [Nonomuraea phyllanthi]KAB8192799.1 SAM-dependent methyltransferase [Nonomuraea phyllanthi]QFY08276.1 SAM-dependent methyltransferase [Nonomuraea phyllanthi]